MTIQVKAKKGFAAMTPEQRRIIASIGGKRAHELGRANTWTSGPDGTAVPAGRKGGSISRKKPRQK